MVQSAADIIAHQQYCRAKAATDGSSFYYATLFETTELKQQLFAIFALHYEVTDCLTASPDPGVIRLKLHWWSEELERLFQQQPRHPVTTSLLPLVVARKITLAPILNYMTVVESIISRPVVSDLEDWLDMLAHGLGQIWSSAANISATVDTATVKLITRNGGIIFTLDLIQNYRVLANRGHEFLPEQLLSRFKLHTGDVISNVESTVFRSLFECLVKRFESELDSCFQSLSAKNIKIPEYPLIMNRIARTLCSEISKDGYRLLEHRIALTPLRKLWIAYRTRVFS